MCNEFAKAIVAIHHEGDMIWMQGFHLLMLPSILARKIPTATTGICSTHHFPSSEIFRTLSMREDLMRGLLNADQICFAQYALARHFQAVVAESWDFHMRSTVARCSSSYTSGTSSCNCVSPSLVLNWND